MRFAVAIIIAVLATILLGCAQKSEEKVIHVYCGAGMRKPMDEIAKEFEKE